MLSLNYPCQPCPSCSNYVTRTISQQITEIQHETYNIPIELFDDDDGANIAKDEKITRYDHVGDVAVN